MTFYHTATVTLSFAGPYMEEELWQMLDQLGHHSPAARLHRAKGWEEQGFETEEDLAAGRYTAAEISVGTEARDEEDLYDAGRRLTNEVLGLFPGALFDRVELMSMNLGDPDNVAYAGGLL
jgi:hypothetical protein